jgi:hypothetical protein
MVKATSPDITAIFVTATLPAESVAVIRIAKALGVRLRDLFADV